MKIRSRTKTENDGREAAGGFVPCRQRASGFPGGVGQAIAQFLVGQDAAQG
jgi:hypothetical protein